MHRRHKSWTMHKVETYKHFEKIMVEIYGERAMREFKTRKILQYMFSEDIWNLICDYEMSIRVQGPVPVTAELFFEFLFRPEFLKCRCIEGDEAEVVTPVSDLESALDILL